MIRETCRFDGAGASPAVLVSMIERKPAGGTPAPQYPVLDRDAFEREAVRTLRGWIAGLGE